jgi:protein TonB
MAFITLISTSADGQHHRQFHSDEYSLAALGLMDNSPGDAPLTKPPKLVVPSDTKPVIIPAGVMVAMQIHTVNPEYPAKAKKASISGIVILVATISKTGEISDLHAKCGPEILQEPSLKAVREWKYRPYLMHANPLRCKQQ